MQLQTVDIAYLIFRQLKGQSRQREGGLTEFKEVRKVLSNMLNCFLTVTQSAPNKIMYYICNVLMICYVNIPIVINLRNRFDGGNYCTTKITILSTFNTRSEIQF